MRLVDADKFLERVKKDREHEIYLHSWTADMVLKRLDSWYAPTIEAIPKAEYEARLKADMVAMLEGIRFLAEENIENIYKKDEDNILMLAQHNAFADCFAQYNSLIEDKIDALKE